MKAMKKFTLPFHVVKRSPLPLWKSLLFRVLAVVAALLFCALLSTVMIGANPIKFIATMFQGAFEDKIKLWMFAKDTCVLLCIALAITPAFKMRFWNIGAEGQTLISAFAAYAVIYYCRDIVPEWLLLVLMFIAALLIGAIWGGIPAIFKAIWNTNETLFTLMMNYVASGLAAYFLIVWSQNGTSVPRFEVGSLPIIGHENLLLIILVIILTIGMYIYQRYTKHGYEISVVGESENTAKYVGINTKKVIIRTMLISGAICGFAGFLIVGAIDHSVSDTMVGGRGFTAIMVSWLANFNPLIMIGTSAFITFLKLGAGKISLVFDIHSAFPDIVVGIALFFVIGCEFFINYRLKKKATKDTAPSLQTEKNNKGGNEK